MLKCQTALFELATSSPPRRQKRSRDSPRPRKPDIASKPVSTRRVTLRSQKNRGRHTPLRAPLRLFCWSMMYVILAWRVAKPWES